MSSGTMPSLLVRAPVEGFPTQEGFFLMSTKAQDADRRRRIAALLRKLAKGIETGLCGDMWEFIDISEEEHANLHGVLRDLATEQELVAIGDQVSLIGSDCTAASLKADKIMTRKEYFDLPLYHWHSVCWDYAGPGSVGIKYDGRSPAR